MYNRLALPSFLLASILGLSACTEPGETTAIGAATGGVLGAGLGAIVGSATGDPGAGLVLGAVAGSAAGAAVGNAVEGQEKIIRTQDEAIERHERIISAQRGEIDELRRAQQDGPLASLRRGQVERSKTAAVAPLAVPKFDTLKPTEARGVAKLGAAANMRERDLTRQASGSALRQSFNEREANSTVSNVSQTEPKLADAHSIRQPDSAVVGNSVGALAPQREMSDCVQAGQEASKATSSFELADKLFHLRRALRLCPDKAEYHNELGEVYSALNRKADAAFEFRETLRLDPDNQDARNNLQSLKQ
jgi:hypothetical protein